MDGCLNEQHVMNSLRLRTAIVEKFAPRFAPHAKLIYAKSAGNVAPVVDKRALKRLGLSLENQSMWPDVILNLPRKRCVYLVDIAAVYGPISPPRRYELEAMFANKNVRCMYISAFLDFKEFKRHGLGIAWGTEVWIGEVPDHLIHFNGDKYLSPRRPPAKPSKPGKHRA